MRNGKKVLLRGLPFPVSCTIFRHVSVIAKSTYIFVISISWHVSVQLPLNRFLWNLILRTFMKISKENTNLVKIRRKYWSLYMETQVCCILLTVTCVVQLYIESTVVFSWQCFQYLFYCWQTYVCQKYKGFPLELLLCKCTTVLCRTYIAHIFFVSQCTLKPWRWRHRFLQSCIAFYETTC